MREKNSFDAEKYRKELQLTVESKDAKPGNRDLAMDALVETGDFEGRDEWYFSLLEDETLHDLRVNGTTYTGLTTLLNHSPSDKYTAKMLELVKSSNAAVRSAAVRNLATLLDDKNPEVVQALLPWLENPNWAKETNAERRLLVTALREFAIPESVPGLIAVLNEKQSQNTGMPSINANVAVVMNSNSVSRNDAGMTSIDYYPYRDEAINALATQKICGRLCRCEWFCRRLKIGSAGKSCGHCLCRAVSPFPNRWKLSNR
jgi:HEAT repeat protein